MTKPIRALMLEDVQADVDFNTRELHKAGIQIVLKHVDSEGSYRQAIHDFKPEVILSDYSLPGFDGLAALEIARQHCPEVPFIFVSGAIGEETAIEALKAGATDYVLKDRLSRLGPSVQRALREVEDRAARRLAQERSREFDLRFRQLAENIREVFWMSDPGRHELLYVSPAYETIWGHSCQSLHDDPLSFLNAVVAEDREHVTAMLKAQVEGNESDIEYRIIRPDGTARWIRDRSFPIANRQGQVYRVAGIAEDVTDRKRVEEQKTVLFQQEQTARAEAERVSRLKDEFLAMLSHELRTPLTPILGWTRLLRTTPRLDDATLANALEVIDRNATAQSRLVEDLLDVSGILAGKLQLHPLRTDLRAVIQAGIDTVRSVALAKGIQLEFSPDSPALEIECDPDRMRQVVCNLLSNAIKFTARGGHVSVKLTNAGPEAHITVTDDGEGIDPAYMPHIFDAFNQADSSMTRTHGGLGLGLRITKHLVERHCGTIRAESLGKGKGAIFTVCIPTSPAGMQCSTLQSRQSKSGLNQNGKSRCLDGLHILVVDDEPDTLDLVATVLKQHGAKVTQAASTSEAIRAIDTTRPDILISDLGMPGEDGYVLLNKVRGYETEGKTPIPAIALTAHVLEADRHRVLSAGFRRHIAKPVEPSELALAVAEIFGRKE